MADVLLHRISAHAHAPGAVHILIIRMCEPKAAESAAVRSIMLEKWKHALRCCEEERRRSTAEHGLSMGLELELVVDESRHGVRTMAAIGRRRGCSVTPLGGAARRRAWRGRQNA